MIGLTSAAVQRQLGVDSPDFGMLFADMAVPDGAEIPAGAVSQAKAEAEVALVLDTDLAHERHTVADLIRATTFALPVIEVVGSRIRDWDITLVDTVADNASSGLYVLGTRPVAPADLNLRLAEMIMERRGSRCPPQPRPWRRQLRGRRRERRPAESMPRWQEWSPEQATAHSKPSSPSRT